MPRRRPDGMVFVSYAHEDLARVQPLLDLLAEEFNVWWDRQLELGSLWRQALANKIDTARCLVVLWTLSAARSEFVWDEVDRKRKRSGTVVPVMLEPEVEIPLGFGQLQFLDLSRWRGGRTRKLDELFERIRRLVERPSRKPLAHQTLEDASYAVQSSIGAADQLIQDTETIATIAGLLRKGTDGSRELRSALRQIDKTYGAVRKAVARFLKPIEERGKLELAPYLNMERGTLVTRIEGERGHCSRILESYGRVGGLRDSIQDRLDRQRLLELDDVFGRLSEADGDMFDRLGEIGGVLTEEASAIVGLLLAGQQREARERLLRGREKLLPLEARLTEAMRRMREIQSSMGYVAKAGKASR